MWKIYVILALWTQSLNAQQDVYVTHSRGDSEKNTLLASQNNNNAIIPSPQLARRRYNIDSKDSFENTHALAEDHLFSHTKEIQQNANNTQPTAKRKNSPENFFNLRLFDIMSSINRHDNMVYSPISLHTLLAFISTISDGKLFEELAHLLAISNNHMSTGKFFENLLQTALLNTPPTILIMANKLYYDYHLGPIDHNIRNFAKKSFASEMEQIDFFASKKAAGIINSWISEQTHNRIQNIVTPSSITGDTKALLLNSLYFKSEWLKKFATDDTEPQDFFISRQSRITVNMMYNEDIFRYGDFHEDLQASVLELPYKTSNLSMLLFLPKDLEGLPDMEKKLKYCDLQSISEKLKRETVTVKLPRFKIEQNIDMREPLREMQLYSLFDNTGVTNLFQNQPTPLKIDQFKHKVFINVNEAGTEAAATTVAKYVPLSIPSDMKYFVADHPFVFAIRSINTTIFIGHVVRF